MAFEENEAAELAAMAGVVAATLGELEAERRQVRELLDLARNVYERGEDSKFEKLREVIRDPHWRDQKILVFTEHRDTLNFIIQSLEAMGFAARSRKSMARWTILDASRRSISSTFLSLTAVRPT
jgi:ERCC4-related helicase